MKDRMS